MGVKRPALGKIDHDIDRRWCADRVGSVSATNAA